MPPLGPTPWLPWPASAPSPTPWAQSSVSTFATRSRSSPSGTISDRAARHERTANLALVLAYAISVCLYIHILAAFLLGGLGINTPFRENIVCVIIIAAIGAMGRFRGLDMLLVLERWALRITGLLILVLIAGFAVFDWRAITTHTLQWPVLPEAGPLDRSHRSGRNAHRGAGLRDVALSGLGVRPGAARVVVPQLADRLDHHLRGLRRRGDAAHAFPGQTRSRTMGSSCWLRRRQFCFPFRW